jgi:hypothetical protein
MCGGGGRWETVRRCDGENSVWWGSFAIAQAIRHMRDRPANVSTDLMMKVTPYPNAALVPHEYHPASSLP